MKLSRWTLVVLSVAWPAAGWKSSYRDYQANEPVAVRVNKIFSDRTQLPHNYYQLPVCKPTPVHKDGRNVGQLLRGDLMQSSLYQIHMNEEKSCDRLNCSITLSRRDAEWLIRLIKDEYRAEWFVDGLPTATFVKGENIARQLGFRLGSYDSQTGRAYVNNHIVFLLAYHPVGDRRTVVGALVRPVSIENAKECADAPTAARLEVKEGATLQFFYSVEWRLDPDTPWEHRWDRYIVRSDTAAHLFSVMNALVVLVAATTLIGLFFLRSLRRDLATSLDVELEDEPGWKRVARDVFRPPTRGKFLAPLIGAGVQMLFAVLGLLVLALFGVFQPSYYGGAVTWLVYFYIGFAPLGGFVSGGFFKFWEDRPGFAYSKTPLVWQTNALYTALWLPVPAFGLLMLVNLFMIFKRASTALSLSSLVYLVLLLVILTVLVFSGAFVAERLKPVAVHHPVSPFPRPNIETVWYMHTLPNALLVGLVPFAMFFFELRFLMRMLWTEQIYYTFGVLTIDAIVLMIACVEVTLFVIYRQLSHENYRWWWRSFWVGCGSTVYVFLYAIHYFRTRSGITSFVSGVVYFVDTLLVAAVYGVCTGTAGMLACFVFLQYLYAHTKP